MKAYIKTEKLITFGDIKIQKQKFHKHKRPISIKNTDIKGFKYFIGYKDAKRFNPLCIILPKISAYRRDFGETKYMSFLIKDNELLEKHNEIWEKVKNNLKKEFDREPVYNEKYQQAKIKSCNGKINTNFHNNKIPKEDSQFICLSMIMINSVIKTSKNYYPEVFLEECKYFVKEKRFLTIYY